MSLCGACVFFYFAISSVLQATNLFFLLLFLCHRHWFVNTQQCSSGHRCIPAGVVLEVVEIVGIHLDWRANSCNDVWMCSWHCKCKFADIIVNWVKRQTIVDRLQHEQAQTWWKVTKKTMTNDHLHSICYSLWHIGTFTLKFMASWTKQISQWTHPFKRSFLCVEIALSCSCTCRWHMSAWGNDRKSTTAIDISHQIQCHVLVVDKYKFKFVYVNCIMCTLCNP